MKQIIGHVLVGSVLGGCERNAIAVIRHSPNVKHEVLILGEPGIVSELLAREGAHVQHHAVDHRSPWALSKAVETWTSNVRPDGAIFWHGLNALPQIMAAFQKQSVKLIVHGGNPALNMPFWIEAKFRLLEVLFRVKFLPQYFCCSQHVADSFDSSPYLRRFSRCVIPNGVEVVENLHIASMFKNPEKPFVIGMTARLDDGKDHATVLRAFAEVLIKRPYTQLELLGDGALRATLEEQAKKLGLQRHIKFLGTVTDVYAIMRQWNLFVYATTEQEGFGNSLAEAMMLGLPCIATNIGPISEVAGTPAAVGLVEPKNPTEMSNAILELVESPSKRETLATAGRLRAQKEFSPALFSKRVLDLLISRNLTMADL